MKYVNLRLEEKEQDHHGENSDDKVTISAIATVTDDSGRPVKKTIVSFTLDGKSKATARTNDDGVAMCDIKVKPQHHPYEVEARTLGVDCASDIQSIEVHEHKKQLPGCWWILIVLYWSLLWFWGPGWLIATYLALTMGVLALIAKYKEKSFWEVFTNNNWVFWATVGSTIITWIMWHFNPLAIEPSGLVDPLEEEGFWGTVNRFYFDESYTDWWDYMFWILLFCNIPAAALSFHDETGKILRKLLGGGHGKDGGFVKHGVWDLLYEQLWRILGIHNK